jgi:predicted RNA-binding protein with PIN domain
MVIMRAVFYRRVGAVKERNRVAVLAGNGKSGKQNPRDIEQDPPPPRIDPNSLIPVRRQIRYVKALKEEIRKSAYRAPKSKVTYRKDTKTSEEYRQIRLAAEKEAMLLSKKESKNFALRKLYNTMGGSSMNSRKNALRATRTVPVLLVDGYNILHVWEKTKILMEEGELEEAREVLIHQLEVYSCMNAVRVCVAFDAMYNRFSNMGTSESLLDSGVTVAYCGDKEADSFLTSQAKEWIKRGASQVVVATNDSTLQVAVESTKTEGPQICFTVPSSGLINDMDRTEKRALAQVGDSGTPDLCLLECVVKSKDMDTFDKLQQLRQGLVRKQ